MAGFTDMVLLALSTSVMGGIVNWQYAYLGQSASQLPSSYSWKRSTAILNVLGV